MKDRLDAKDDFDAIERVAEQMYQVSADHGFHDGEARGQESATIERLAIFIANLHGECSELWEAARKGQLFQNCDKEFAPLALPPLNNAEEELADIVIRAMDTAHTLGVRLGRAIAIKTEYNRQRAHKHGKKC
jgi:NTP pyrophosphatase (non-canonical NTP hydrolase)